MATRIKLKRSEIPTSVPSQNDLQTGEVAINTFDQKMYVKDSNGAVVEVANKGASDAEVTTKATIMAIALG
jgi:hypothetical protein